MNRKLTTIAATAAVTAGMATAANAEEVRIGWTAWADAEFMTRMAEDVITERFDTDVELIQTGIAPQYTGLAEGDIDLMLMSWQPTTHEDYIDEYGDEIVDLGVLYSDAKLGWIVPIYLYEQGLTSIEDLKDPEWRDRLDGRIQGIDPGAGLTRLSHKTVEEYDLDYNLIESSGAAMTAALARAARRDEPIVVTGWSPHWMFGAWNLRYLDDPKGTLGGPESIHAMSREGFKEDFPTIASFASCINIEIDTLNKYMFRGREEGTDQAVQSFLDEKSDLVDSWVQCARSES